MSYVLMLGSGGWPMSVFLTPDLKPFVGGGYYPPEDRDGMLGFRTLLERVASDWSHKRDLILQAADNGASIMASEAQGLAASSSNTGRPDRLDGTFREFKASYDVAHGGFGTGQKFPRPAILNFLFREYARTGKRESLDMALETLRAMARGGIHDQLGGGFHRYATDGAWRVPHFEKMLYDQAQIAEAYVDAYQLTKDGSFGEMARDVLEYVLGTMRDQDGGFLSAEDADSVDLESSRRSEGAFYLWTADEVRAAVGDRLSPLVDFYYGIEASGNIPHDQDVQRQLAGKNVLFVAHTEAETAAEFNRSPAEVHQAIDTARQELRIARQGRPRPLRDDKVLVEWNGLMISALARASQVLDEPRYRDAALASARLIEARLYDARSNRLERRYWHGEVGIDGLLEDYAFLIQGLLDLYEASFDMRWLTWAIALQERQDALFWDPSAGTYFSTPASASHILVRMRDDFDGAEPSANSVAALNLLRLAHVTGRQDWRQEADAIARALDPRWARSPSALPQLAVAVGFRLSTPKEIIIAGAPGAPDTEAMLRLVNGRFLPNKILLLIDAGPAQQQLSRLLPVVANMDRRDGRATMYVCQNYACQLPTSDLQTAARLLDAR
jgi:uncharacterized protein YyaL (SSP411 family)